MDKKNDILQTYRKRKDEFRLPLKDDGWKRLEAALADIPNTRRSFPYRLLSVAAIGIICVAAGLTFLFVGKDRTDKQLVDLPETEITGETSIALDDTTDIREEIKPENTFTLPVVANNKKTTEPISLPNIKDGATHQEDLQKDEDVIPVEEASPDEPVEHKQNRQIIGPQPENKRKYNTHYQIEKRYTASRWGFGLSSGANNFSGATGGVANYYYTNPGPNPPEPPIEPEELGNETLQTKAAAGQRPGGNSGNDYYEHDMPISVSFSVRRYFTNRLAVESGLSYTYLHSDITRSNMAKGEQTVHYLGVPLKLNWDLIRKGPFSLYLSGGGMVEYCLSARKESSSMDIDRWQYSIHGAVGIQTRLYKQLGLFVEPGVAYYFNPPEKMETETIRTVRPFTFNLQVGIRLSY